MNSEQRLIRESILEFAKLELNHDVITRDKEQHFSRDLWEKCGDLRLQGLPVDDKYDGGGLDAVSSILALMALGKGSHDGGLNFSICAHLLACVIPIWKFGSEALKEKYLPELCNGKKIAVNGMTETESGSDAFNMKTTAKKVDGGYIINGVKTFGSNGPVADYAVLYAKTDESKGFNGGVTAFLIDVNTEGVEMGQKYEKMGLRTCPISEIVYNNVFVSNDSLIGEEGAGGYIFNHSMEWERVGIAACHVGTMERLLEKSVKYANVRKVGGQTIGKHQAISHRIADMKLKVEASRMLTLKAAWGLENNKYNSLDSSITKVYVSEAINDVAMDTLKIHGGNGYMVDYEIERTLRDSIGGVIYSGTSDVQRNIIARWVGVK